MPYSPIVHSNEFESALLKISRGKANEMDEGDEASVRKLRLAGYRGEHSDSEEEESLEYAVSNYVKSFQRN